MPSNADRASHRALAQAQALAVMALGAPATEALERRGRTLDDAEAKVRALGAAATPMA